ncbi:MAG TPA: NADPH-dependent 7-cyano-7-deazaguanine reductase QueF [Thermoplasmatales archaeon]|nr:preQ(1) synthase [Candidatus Thermoplasmatota archaeon]MDD5777900.1 preQ(1) synthase [Candidatus Thermoplasmatota archaeon]HDS59909.1 NADPH-dependent 7-cyano-7-deazaguanine reductase QueF [Thermoplasmatales archaeon]
MHEKRYGEQAVESSELEVWDNPSPEKDYTITIDFPEFTCLCPRSGYPDFAVITISYIPDQYIVELKSLKLYLNDFREQHLTHEEATNRIFDDLVALLDPRRLEVVGDFNVRGGMHTTVVCSTDDYSDQ